MLVRRFWIAVVAAAVMSAAVATAQTPAPSAGAAASQVSAAVPDGGVPEFVRPETAEQRKLRLGTAEDPGPDPDPAKHFWRYGNSFHISKFERRLATYDSADANYVRPLGMVNFSYEIYQQNEKYVWCWMPDLDPVKVEQAVATLPENASRFRDEDLKFFARVRSQFSELTPPDAFKSISFADSSAGLPTAGSWRNTLAIADMNGDGCPDIIPPPERKGSGLPTIFLGDCKGNWTAWQGTTWPHGIDYGGVAAADFNKDGKMDLAFAVHLNGVYVFLGDGKGHFTESSEGLPRNFPTRRVVVADADGDGWPDLIALSEGPDALSTRDTSYGRIRVFLNRKKGASWEAVSAVDPKIDIGGDWLAVGNFNDDRIPDILSSSNYLNGTTVVHMSDGPKKWKYLLTDGDVIPTSSYFLANSAGKFVRDDKKDQAIVSYVRYWPTDLDNRQVATPPVTELTAVDRISFVPDGLGMKRESIMRWNGHVGIHGLASADFDGDGNLDLIFTKEEPGKREVVLLLGDGKGGFKRARVDGIKLEDNNLYDVKVADVNGDGRPDVVLMYETLDVRRDDMLRIAVMNQPGSIKVFLNRGSKSAPADSMKAAK